LSLYVRSCLCVCINIFFHTFFLPSLLSLFFIRVCVFCVDVDVYVYGWVCIFFSSMPRIPFCPTLSLHNHQPRSCTYKNHLNESKKT
jgi:hypothetical protein